MAKLFSLSGEETHFVIRALRYANFAYSAVYLELKMSKETQAFYRGCDNEL